MTTEPTCGARARSCAQPEPEPAGGHFNDHCNDIGDKCPYADEAVPKGYLRDRCPQDCRGSYIDTDDEEGTM